VKASRPARAGVENRALNYTPLDRSNADRSHTVADALKGAQQTSGRSRLQWETPGFAGLRHGTSPIMADSWRNLFAGADSHEANSEPTSWSRPADNPIRHAHDVSRRFSSGNERYADSMPTSAHTSRSPGAGVTTDDSPGVSEPRPHPRGRLSPGATGMLISASGLHGWRRRSGSRRAYAARKSPLKAGAQLSSVSAPDEII